NLTAENLMVESNFAFINTGHPDDFKRGIAPFVDQSDDLGLSKTGWAWDVRMADFDNSSHLDVVQSENFMRGRINRVPELQEITLVNQALVPFPLSWHKFDTNDELAGHRNNAFMVQANDGR